MKKNVLYFLSILLLFMLAGVGTKTVAQTNNSVSTAIEINSFPHTEYNVSSANGGSASGIGGSCSTIPCCSVVVFKVVLPSYGSLRVDNDNYSYLSSSIIAYTPNVPNPTTWADITYYSGPGNFCGFRDSMQIGRFNFTSGNWMPGYNSITDAVPPGEYYILFFNENQQSSLGIGTSSNLTFQFAPYCPTGYFCGTIAKTIFDNTIYASPSGKQYITSGNYTDTVTGVAAGGADSIYFITLNYQNTTFVQNKIANEALCPGSDDLDHNATTNLASYAEFNKSNSNWMEINDVSDSLAGRNRSVFMWMRHPSTVSSTGQILHGINTSSGGNVCNMYISTNEELSMHDGSNAHYSGVTVTGGAWHYVGYTYDESTDTTKVYVDGVMTTKYKNAQSVSATNKISLGQEYDNSSKSNFYDGEMTEASIWNEVLDASEIALIMAEPVNASHPQYNHLVAHYSMNVVGGDDVLAVVDHSPNGFHGLASANTMLKTDALLEVPQFNSASYFDVLWKKDGAIYSTIDSIETSTYASGTYELILSRDYFTITDNWTVTKACLGVNTDIVISEINYNPAESGVDTTEYIELYNKGTGYVDLTGWSFTSGVGYTFPSVIINPGEYFVISVDSNSIQYTYGYANAYQWTSGGLSNGGEPISLRDNNNILIDTVRYDDVAPWPTDADGFGYSIVRCDANSDGKNGANWSLSGTNANIIVNGISVYSSPGAADDGCTGCTETTSSISPVVCNSYTSPSSKYTWTTTGIYKDTIPNVSGCDSVITINLTIGTSPVVASTVIDNNVSCNGYADGGMTSSATGGATPYLYAWSNAATTASITGIAAGTYSVTITDDNGCTSTANGTVTQATSLIAATVIDSNVSCNGYSDGGMTAGATGGTTPYMYAWSNGATTASITGIGASTYSVTITDNNGCSSTNSGTVTQATAIIASTLIDSNVSCNGYYDGGMTSSATGGTTPYMYAWSNGATTASITGIGAATYSVTITDNNGCSSTNSGTVTQATAIVAATVIDSNVSCNGYYDGGMTSSATGGTTPYMYAWSNGATTASITGIGAATYSVTITDNKGCTSTSNGTVTQATALVASTVVDSNVSVYSGVDGGLTASALGGTIPYMYAWSNGATTASVAGIGAGTYSVTITDQNGCTSNSSSTVTQPASITASAVVDANVSCNGFSNGGATVTYSGGSGNITYAWSNSATTASIAGIVAGTYTVTITDGASNTATSSVTITQPASLVAFSVIDSNISCNGYSDGGMTAGATGGTTPYIYAWSNGATTASIAGIGAATYSVTITDNNGCTSTNSGTVTQATAIVASTLIDSNVSCNGYSDGGMTSSAAGGTTPYMYAWSNGATTASIAGIGAATYSVTITDNNGCTSTNSGTVTQATAIIASTVIDSNVSCNGYSDGGITAGATGGTTPYMYAWSNGATTASIAGIGAATYSVTITDNNGCSSTNSGTVTQATAIIASTVIDSNVSCNGYSDGGMTAGATGGTTPYLYSWSNAATTATIVGVTSGTYSVTITDNNGCTSSNLSTITEPTLLVATASVVSDASCATTSDGALTVVANGSVSSYTYLWSNNVTTTANSALLPSTYTITVTDGNGCTATDSETVVANDLTLPTVITQNLSVYLDVNGAASITTTQIDNGSTDNCGIQTYSLDQSTFACSDLGANTVNLTITDNSSNSASAATVVTVLDTLKPVLLAASGYNAYLDNTGSVVVSVSDIDNGSSDNCSLDSLWLSGNVFNCSSIAPFNLVLHATDLSGNEDSMTVIISVLDTISPMISGSNINVYLDSTGNASIVLADVAPLIADNCGMDTSYLSSTSFDCSSIGANTIQLVGVDNSSNTSYSPIQVQVMDTILPYFTNMKDTSICGNVISFEMPTTWDNCSNPLNTQVGGPVQGSTQLAGDYFIVFELTDNANNSITDSLKVSLHDIPVLDLGSDSTICINWEIELTAPAGYTYLWSTGSTNQVLNIPANTLLAGYQTIDLTVTNTAGCTAKDEIVFFVKYCTDIQEAENLLNFELYPNPNKGSFIIDIEPIEAQTIRLELMSSNGDIVWTSIQEIKDHQSIIEVNQQHFAKGIYFLKVSGDNWSTYKKVVIQ